MAIPVDEVGASPPGSVVVPLLELGGCFLPGLKLAFQYTNIHTLESLSTAYARNINQQPSSQVCARILQFAETFLTPKSPEEAFGGHDLGPKPWLVGYIDQLVVLFKSTRHFWNRSPESNQSNQSNHFNFIAFP